VAGPDQNDASHHRRLGEQHPCRERLDRSGCARSSSGCYCQASASHSEVSTRGAQAVRAAAARMLLASRGDDLHRSVWDRPTQVAHNSYISVLVEEGLVGFLLLLHYARIVLGGSAEASDAGATIRAGPSDQPRGDHAPVDLGGPEAGLVRPGGPRGAVQGT